LTARIIQISSSTYGLAPALDVSDLNCQGTNGRLYGMFAQYAQSKLAQIVLSQELHQRYHEPLRSLEGQPRCRPLWTAAVHPGLVRTDVVRNMPWYLKYPNLMFSSVIAAFQKTPSQGAWNTIHCCYAPTHCRDDGGLNSLRSGSSQSQPVNASLSGLYWVNRRPQSVRSCVTKAAGLDLWNVSARLVGLDQSSSSQDEITDDQEKKDS
jgi:hypothetical protein